MVLSDTKVPSPSAFSNPQLGEILAGRNLHVCAITSPIHSLAYSFFFRLFRPLPARADPRPALRLCSSTVCLAPSRYLLLCKATGSGRYHHNRQYVPRRYAVNFLCAIVWYSQQRYHATLVPHRAASSPLVPSFYCPCVRLEPERYGICSAFDDAPISISFLGSSFVLA